MLWTSGDLYNLGVLLSAIDSDIHALWSVMVVMLSIQFSVLVVLLLNVLRRS